MKKFVGFCRGGRVRHAVCAGVVTALCFLMFCATGAMSHAAAGGENAAVRSLTTGLESPAIRPGTAGSADSEDPAGASAAAGGVQTVVSPDPLSDDDLQIVLSMGELPETICISWKGEADGPGYIKIGCSRKALKTVKAVRASSEKALKGSYCRYSARFDGLEPGERYYYVIGSFEEDDDCRDDRGGTGRWVKAGRVRSFRMPDLSDPTQFLYLGDVQFDVSPEEYEQWGKMTEKIFSENPGLQFAVLGGDMVNIPGEYEQWNGFLKNCGVFSRVPLMTVSGNHEGVSSNRTYKKMFAVPDNGPASGQTAGISNSEGGSRGAARTSGSKSESGDAASAQPDNKLAEELRGDFYYFDQSSCRFIMTDSSFLTGERIERLGTRSWQLCEKKIEKWLTETLEENPGSWNIVVTHHPPYGLHDRDTVSPQLRELWVPVLEAHGADLVLCGHQHMYMRTEAIGGIVYVMGNSGNMQSAVYEKMDTLPGYCMAASGDGPNYQIIEAGSRKLQLTSYDADGLIIDRFTIRKSLWEIIAGVFR